MELTPLTAIGPLDGRYRTKLASLAPFVSEYALIQYRVRVEVEYFIALCDTNLAPLSPVAADTQSALRALYQQFTLTDATAIKDIERTTNHDVKAVEYWLKAAIQKGAFSEYLAQQLEFIHFGLTSQDVNNTAIPLMLKEAITTVILPHLYQLIEQLNGMADTWQALPMLARTHGQAASPTTMGKELAVFSTRLAKQVQQLAQLPIPAKFGGATGNMNAHYIAYPAYDWQRFATHFVTKTLGLSRSYPTTQIDHYDGLSAIFDNLKRINSILIDLCQDAWLYISQGYFIQQVKAGEVGSSAMPHKVNPIDFENAEGNCGLSTAMLGFLSRKLPVSRLQRDLTDSTVLRNLGVGLGYSLLAMQSVKRGLGKLSVNEARLSADLADNWAILAEAIQTILRREGYPQPYEALKALTRGNQGITQASLTAFMESLEVSPTVKAELLALSPETYVGNAPHWQEGMN